MSGCDIDIIGDDCEICSMNFSRSTDEVNANAALIVAAPILFFACKWALTEWFDRVYPPDIFVGGPSSDPGVNEVREVAEKLRNAIAAVEGS
jgi:hypothetical protein